MIKPVAVWGQTLINEEGKEPTHRVTSIYVDSNLGKVHCVIEKGLQINSVDMTMEHAQDIGFINIDALNDYCK